MHKLVLLSMNQRIKFQTYSFTHSRDMIEAAPKLKEMGHVTLTMPIRSSLSSKG